MKAFHVGGAVPSCQPRHLAAFASSESEWPKINAKSINDPWPSALGRHMSSFHDVPELF